MWHDSSFQHLARDLSALSVERSNYAHESHSCCLLLRAPIGEEPGETGGVDLVHLHDALASAPIAVGADIAVEGMGSFTETAKDFVFVEGTRNEVFLRHEPGFLRARIAAVKGIRLLQHTFSGI